MGMSPAEYANILYRDLILKLEGFKDRLDYEEGIYRRMAYSSYVAPHLNPKKMARKLDVFWPLSGKGSAEQKKVPDAKRQAIRDYLKKLNGG